MGGMEYLKQLSREELKIGGWMTSSFMVLSRELYNVLRVSSDFRSATERIRKSGWGLQPPPENLNDS